jgi:hypothetical protein
VRVTVPPIVIVSGSALRLLITGAVFPQFQLTKPTRNINGKMRLIIPLI